MALDFLFQLLSGSEFANMIFGEALIIGLLVTTFTLFGVSVHGFFSSNKNSINEMRKLEDKMMEKYGWNPSVSYHPYC